MKQIYKTSTFTYTRLITKDLLVNWKNNCRQRINKNLKKKTNWIFHEILPSILIISKIYQLNMNFITHRDVYYVFAWTENCFISIKIVNIHSSTWYSESIRCWSNSYSYLMENVLCGLGWYIQISMGKVLKLAFFNQLAILNVHSLKRRFPLRVI